MILSNLKYVGQPIDNIEARLSSDDQKDKIYASVQNRAKVVVLIEHHQNENADVVGQHSAKHDTKFLLRDVAFSYFESH